MAQPKLQALRPKPPRRGSQDICPGYIFGSQTPIAGRLPITFPGTVLSLEPDGVNVPPVESNRDNVSVSYYRIGT